jgi:DNA-binding CsgD family transcriptional regulator
MSGQGFNSGTTGNQKGLIADEGSVRLSPASAKFPGLSHRESEVLSWVAKGKTNFEVATILGISRRTVDTLLSRTYQKLGVENRTAAVMRMIKFIKLSAIYFVADFCSDLTFFSAYL